MSNGGGGSRLNGGLRISSRKMTEGGTVSQNNGSTATEKQTQQKNLTELIKCYLRGGRCRGVGLPRSQDARRLPPNRRQRPKVTTEAVGVSLPG